MAFNVQFNAHTVAPQQSLEPLPTGTYDVVIVDTDEKLVKDGNGQSYYEITMQVTQGEFTGRKVIDRLNVKHNSEETRRIANSQFSAICYVTGIMVVQQSSAELHGKPFKITVSKVKRDDDPEKYQNRVVGYKDTMGYEPGKNPGIAMAQTGGGFGGQPPAGFGQQPQQQVQQQTQPAGFGGQPQQQTQPAPSFVTQQTQPQPDQTQQFTQPAPQVQQQQPATQPPPSFASPPPSFAQPPQTQPSNPPPSFAAPQQQTIEHQPVQQQQIDPSQQAGSPVPSWATGG